MTEFQPGWWTFPSSVRNLSKCESILISGVVKKKITNSICANTMMGSFNGIGSVVPLCVGWEVGFKSAQSMRKRKCMVNRWDQRVQNDRRKHLGPRRDSNNSVGFWTHTHLGVVEAEDPGQLRVETRLEGRGRAFLPKLDLTRRI